MRGATPLDVTAIVHKGLIPGNRLALERYDKTLKPVAPTTRGTIAFTGALDCSVSSTVANDVTHIMTDPKTSKPLEVDGSFHRFRV
jgi:hypothetical protein